MIVICNNVNYIDWKEAEDYTNNDLSIFKIKISEVIEYSPHLFPLLSVNEIMRFQSYHREKNQQTFLIARGALRILLGNYTLQAPSEIKFSQGINNKPTLDKNKGIYFNVSHSNDYITIAISVEDIGVDIEEIINDFSYEQIIDHSFSLLERTYIDNNQNKVYLFYQSWTRKEAFVKATGQGINSELRYVPSLDGKHCQLDKLKTFAATYTISSFKIDKDYVAAVAYASGDRHKRINFYTIDSNYLLTNIQQSTID